jgi:hypothetical protein
MEGQPMTRNQAATLRLKWQQQVDPPVCEHPKLELEAIETGYLTDNYQPMSRCPDYDVVHPGSHELATR